MNAYAAVILLALVGTYAAARVADLRNLRSADDEVPAEFADLYDPAAYRRSQAYTRARVRFGIVTSTFDLVVLLVFWLAGGFRWLDDMVRGLGWGPVATGLVFIVVLVAGRAVLSLPFGIYSTFVLEERFGFNRTTPATFASDLAKGLVLSVLLGLPALAALLALFTYAGPQAWVYAWVAAAVLSSVLQLVLPAWIMPLFNRFSPLEPGELREALFAYARSVAFPLGNIVVMDGSRRSSKSNAFFTGFGRTRRIALFDTLIAQHTTPELVAVIAHEVGHYKARHLLKGLAVSVLHLGILFALLSLFLTDAGLFQAFFVQTPSVYAGLVLFGLLLTPVEFILGVALQALSRRHETEADAYAAQTTGDPTSMVNALKKLARNNLSNLTPDPFYVVLHYSHPPVLQRIAALRGSGA